MNPCPTPPSFPLRPVNGGPLPKAAPKSGRWRYEPKINEWRAWVHPLSASMWNRHNEPLSITAEFAPVLARMQAWWQKHWPVNGPQWLDCGALSRRVPVGKGSLVLLDFAYDIQAPFDTRMQDLYQLFVQPANAEPIAQPWAFDQFVPPEHELLVFPYSYEDEATQRADGATVITISEY